MDDVIQIDDQWYYAAGSQKTDSRNQVLKQGDTFAVLDLLGDISRTGLGEQGVYHLGTRHLSHWELLINDRRPMLLNSTMKEDNSVLMVELTTPDIHQGDRLLLPKGQLHASRSIIIEGAILYENLKLTNYSNAPLEFNIKYHYATDFRDIFEVRGNHRSQRGSMLPVEVNCDSAILKYRGLDQIERSTEIDVQGKEQTVSDKEANIHIELEPGESDTLRTIVACQNDQIPITKRSHQQAIQQVSNFIDQFNQERTRIETSNEQFNDWINRSTSDLMMLTSETPHGPYPYAGVPWFSTPFGRDAIITALQTLWIHPQLSKGVLNFLAATQATELDPVAESEPGKIFHEIREGEMAALGEIPFRRYYGTVDATPLFVILAAHYYWRTGDLEFLEKIWTNIKRAIAWIDSYGDPDRDGFLEYMRQNEHGLKQQGWKDSDDSVFHADGKNAEGAIALSEVQGYVYAAKNRAADLAEIFGEKEWASQLRAEAIDLKRKFNERFWVDTIGTFAIALDGDKNPCAVRNSNAGHLLYTGIVEEQYVKRVAETLMDEDTFNGWGIRTISRGELRYNPMSYHNGSIWPHDTALCGAGLSRYGYQTECTRLLAGMFDVSCFLEWHRLPELFCGFDRISGHAPTLYPVACAPQAWAAGSVFMLLQSCLGLKFYSHLSEIRFENPMLPPAIQWISIKNLRMGEATIDCTLRRHPRDVGMNVDRKEGNVKIVLVS